MKSTGPISTGRGLLKRLGQAVLTALLFKHFVLILHIMLVSVLFVRIFTSVFYCYLSTPSSSPHLHLIET